jgi:hypothetical protein
MKHLLILLLLCSCVSREEVSADIWVNETIPKELCDERPGLWNYGISRVVLCKNRPASEFCQHGETSFEEFIPYCDQAMSSYLSMYREDVAKWLEKLTRPKSKGQK